MVAEYFKVLHAQFIPQSPEYPADPAVYITLGVEGRRGLAFYSHPLELAGRKTRLDRGAESF